MTEHLTLAGANGRASRMPHAYARESAKQLEAYALYRDLGSDRSARAVWEALGTRWGARCPTEATVENWCTAWSWVDRAAAYDREVFAREEEARTREDARERVKRKTERLRTATLRRAMALRYMLDGGEPRNIGDLDPKLLSLADRLLLHADDAERLDLGEPTERHEVQGEVLIREYNIPLDRV